MSVRKATFAQLEEHPDFPDLVAEYGAESAMPGLPHYKFDPAKYRNLCAAGLLHTRIAVNESYAVIGFVLVLVTMLPKYSVPVAITEAFFVAKAHRMSGAGLRLLRVAEAIAAERAGGRLLVSAPFGGSLAEVLPRLGYAETNRVFFKQVAHG